MANTILDDFSPIYQFDTGAPFAPVFQYKNGKPKPLTGATITMKMQHEGGTVKDAAGTWVIDDAANGITHYNYAPADVDTAGPWTLFITITIGGKPVHGDSRVLEILPVP